MGDDQARRRPPAQTSKQQTGRTGRGPQPHHAARHPRAAAPPHTVNPLIRRHRTATRLKIGFLLAAIVTSVFATRLFQLQGIDDNDYADLAKQEGARTLELPATRGDILDRDNQPLATSIDGRMIIANPKVTTSQAPQIATIVSRTLETDYFDTLAKLKEPNSQFESLARRVPAITAQQLTKRLDDAGLRGIDLQRDPIRSYPSKDVAANLLGFLGADGEPLGGLELAYDTELAGRDGSTSYEVGADGQRIPLGKNTVTKPSNGTDLRLTIDRDVQWYTQRLLQNATTRSGGVTASATVLDVRSGEVLALADYPTFDANNAAKAKARNLGSRALSDVYEPGSVQKVLTAAALLDAGKVTPRTRIVVPGKLPRQDRVIGDYWDHGKLKLTLTGVLAKSSNIGTVLAADQMSATQLHRYLARFGLGHRTGVGLSGEAPGIMSPATDWSPINKATISFGQSISVNVLQMAAAVNTIANGGVYVPPQLIKSTQDVDDATRASGRRVISEHAATVTSRMMEAVVDPARGTAPLGRIAGYRVAGKTGTAQRANQTCGCYDGTVTVSFAGFAPADAPRFLVYVVIHNPRNGGGGGTVAAPVFRQIMSFLLQRYGVPPTGNRQRPLPVTW